MRSCDSAVPGGMNAEHANAREPRRLEAIVVVDPDDPDLRVMDLDDGHLWAAAVQDDDVTDLEVIHRRSPRGRARPPPAPRPGSCPPRSARSAEGATGS